MLIRIIATVLDLFLAANLLVFINRTAYNNSRMSDCVFWTMIFAFMLSSLMMWK